MKIYIEDNVCTIYKLALHWLGKTLVEHHHPVVENINDADICIAGVCAAFGADEERSIKIINKMKEAGKPIVAYGCMTQINPSRLKHYVLEMVSSWRIDYLANKFTGEYVHPRLPFDFRQIQDYRVCDTGKKFVGISTGCSFSCSYCAHRIGTGNIVSVLPRIIFDDIISINRSGAHTVVLTGIDTACYGQDIGKSFAYLLGEILKRLNSDIDIHIAQFNPEGLFFDRDKLLKLFSDKRIKDIQLPVQTASYDLLKKMNRNYSIHDIEVFIAQLREANEAITLRTDIMIGFPGETKEDLDKTIEFVCKRFDEVAVYSFEPKINTPMFLADFTLFAEHFIEERKQYAIDKIKEAGLLCHSGGQEIGTLVSNDITKNNLRKRESNEE